MFVLITERNYNQFKNISNLILQSNKMLQRKRCAKPGVDSVVEEEAKRRMVALR